MSASPVQNPLVRRRRGCTSGTAVRNSVADAEPDDARRSAGAEAWIGGCIEQVGEKASESDDNATQDHRSSDQVVIAGRDSIGGDVSHAWPAEHSLHEERSAHERGQG